MASTRTFLQMRTRARQKADQENTSFVDEDELKDIVNQQCQGLYDLLIGAWGPEYFVAENEIAIVSDVNKYSLPPDFYKAVSLTLRDGQTKFYSMETWEENEYARLRNVDLTGSGSGGSLRYRISGNFVDVRPLPRSAYTLILRYVPVFERLVGDNDTFDGVNGWEDWIELSSAIQIMIKEESDPSGLLMERQRVEQRIRTLAPTRDAARPARIVDVRRDWISGGYDDWNM